MNSLNQVIIEGNVVRQPEKRPCRTGSFLCSIPIAVNRRYKTPEGQPVDEVSYFEVTTFGPLAETCEKWCPKGRGIRVVGRLKQNIWEDDKGKKNSKVEIIAEHVEFKPFYKKNEGESSGPENATSGQSSVTKDQKMKMLKEAAAAAQKEVDEIEF